jgi:hypothetical protein
MAFQRVLCAGSQQPWVCQKSLKCLEGNDRSLQSTPDTPWQLTPSALMLRTRAEVRAFSPADLELEFVRGLLGIARNSEYSFSGYTWWQGETNRLE